MSSIGFRDDDHARGFAVERKVSPMALVTGALVLVFGGLTLSFSNDIFIKIKPTILYTMFAGVLLGGLVFGRLFIKLLLGQTVQLPDDAWRGKLITDCFRSRRSCRSCSIF